MFRRYISLEEIMGVSEVLKGAARSQSRVMEASMAFHTTWKCVTSKVPTVNRDNPDGHLFVNKLL